MTWAMKKIAAICAFSAVMGVAAANANPIYIGYSLDGGATKNLLSTSITGDALFSGNVGIFHVLATLEGSPSVMSPDLSSTEQTTRNTTGANSAASLKLYFSQTDLITPVSGFLSGFGNNSSSKVSVTEDTYAQSCIGILACNSTIGSDVFATSNLLKSDLVAPGAATTSLFTAYPFPAGSLYNETLVYTFSLARSSNSNANLELDGVAPVPEPLTLSLFGAGIAGIAAARRRKKAA